MAGHAHLKPADPLSWRIIHTYVIQTFGFFSVEIYAGFDMYKYVNLGVKICVSKLLSPLVVQQSDTRCD